jgi:hypothetical protein
LSVQLVCEDRAFAHDVLAELAAGPQVADEHEVPGLAEPHARCGVRGIQDPAQHLGGYRGAGELTPDITPTVHDLVKAILIHWGSLPPTRRTISAASQDGGEPLIHGTQHSSSRHSRTSETTLRTAFYFDEDAAYDRPFTNPPDVGVLSAITTIVPEHRRHVHILRGTLGSEILAPAVSTP